MTNLTESYICIAIVILLHTALVRLEVSNLHPAPTPICSIKEFNHQVPTSAETKHEAPTSDKLRQIAGVLNYAVTTCRPDLSVAASALFN